MVWWQAIVSICAGFITVLTLLEKLGLTKTFKKLDNEFSELKTLPKDVKQLHKDVNQIASAQKAQNQAMLALLRNDLYRCFKDNRGIGAWTDNDCQVQTKLHESYHNLGGNGEETIWWDKKRTWKIVTDEEYHTLVTKS